MIVLIGFMGAGKTTIGTLLAARLELPFADSDQVIEQRAGRQVQRIFAEDGEPAFRALEHQVIAGLLDGPEMIIALGGGAAEHPRTQDKLGASPAAQVVYLQVGYDQALRRVGQDTGRPMLVRPDLAAVYERRRGVYARLATLTVGTDDRHPETVRDDILAMLARVPAVGGRAPYPGPRPGT
ncbi:MAG: shikimate kinase [Streptosporangiaceae bacterium]|jgi:shikimate kinase